MTFLWQMKMKFRSKVCCEIIKQFKSIFTFSWPRKLTLTVLLIIISYGISFTHASPPTDEAELDHVTLALKWKHQFQFAGYYAAIEQGYYCDVGLDVTIIEATLGEESSESVIQGEAEFGTAMSDLVLLRASGYPVVAMAAIFQHSPLVILASKQSGIQNIHDLVGKRISLEDHADDLLAYLSNEGISADKLTIEPHYYDTGQLIAGVVDAMSAYSTDEPYLLLEEDFEYNIFSPRASGIDFYGDVLYTTEDQIKNHPERVAAFHDASLKGWQYAMAHKEEVIELILTNYSQRHSREHLLFEAEQSSHLMMMDVVEIGYMKPGRWQHITSTYQQMGTITADFSLDGFIYDQDPEPDLRRLYFSLVIAILIAFLVMIIGAYFYHLNKKLTLEMSKRELLIIDLQKAASEIKMLQGIVPICSFCKNVRDDRGYWNQVESYVSERSDADFSHSICPDCAEIHYPDIDMSDIE
jgi:ABC-type nitrate/sulfonate/bicarbonate transport system substrate-binding protein